MITLPITRIDQSLPMPEYKTSGAVAFDLYVRETTTVPANGMAFVPNNYIVDIPEGYGLFIMSRSSTPKRLHISQPHGVGLIDQDYCGPTDELKTLVYNFSNEEVIIERGDRISQAFLTPIPQITFEERVEGHGTASRGGFGSTSGGDLSHHST